jgi:predicted RNase H-like nuclease (RuvC/YqgF family)
MTHTDLLVQHNVLKIEYDELLKHNQILIAAFSERIKLLESQLSTLTASNLEKEKEIERLEKEITDHSAEWELICNEDHRANILERQLQSAVEVIEFYADEFYAEMYPRGFKGREWLSKHGEVNEGAE